MKYILAGIVLAVLIGTARGEIVDLGGGEYKAVIQSDSSQTGTNWNWSVVNYVSGSHSHTINTAYTYTGRYDNLFYGDNEKYRNWHEFSLWQIPDDAIIDSVILVVRSYILYGDSISIDVVNLNGNRPSFQSPQDLWNQIGAAMTYVNNTKIYWSSYEPKWRLPGAENTIQSRLGTANEWFATGFRSNWENRDSVLLDAFDIELWVYFKVEPHVHVEKPNGGEIFYIGLEDTIQWTASDYDNYVDYVYILLSRDGGNSYTLIGQVTNTLHSNPWSGEYVWHVTGPESHQCKIRIIAYDTDGLQSRDESDNVFSIENMPRPQTELLWPNSPGITVEEADTYAIGYNGDAVAGIKNVEALFSYDGGQTWPDTIGKHPYHEPYPTHVENDTILWPVTQHPTEHGRVKVVLYDAANQTAVDTSDYDITVMPARPSDITANVSENYRQVTLTWTDRSRYNSGYEIRRIDEEGNVRTITINDSDATSYVDHTVAPFHTYDYKIRAINNDGVASEWVTERVYNTPTFLVQNASKVMHKGNKEYIAIAQSVSGSKWHGMVILLKSSMDGINWTTEDTIYRLISDSVISSFSFDMIPVDLQNGVKFVGLATYKRGNSEWHVTFITYKGIGLHGAIEVFFK